MNKDQLDFQSQQHDPYEDEIELMDYLKVLWKWKYLIILGTLACAVIATIVSFNMTKIYSVKTVLAPGILKVEEDGKINYIGSPQEIKTLIETGALESTVLKQVKVPNGEDLPLSLSFKTTVPKSSNALEITYETPRTDLGLQIMTLLNQAMLQKFDATVQYLKKEYVIQSSAKANESSEVTEKITKAKNEISTVEAENLSNVSKLKAKISSKKTEMAANESEKASIISEMENRISGNKSIIFTNEATLLSQIEQKENGISTLNAGIAAKKKQIKNLENRITDVEAEIVRIAKNTDLLLEERDRFLSSTKNENNILASVMYTNTIQQNISYLNSLRSTVNNVNHKTFQEHVGIEKLENNIKDLQTQKTNLNKQTKINNEKLMSDIKALQSQISNAEKQTSYKNETIKSDMEDYESQIKSLVAQMDSKKSNLSAEISTLESQKSFFLEQIKNLGFKKNYVQNIQILQPPKSSLSPIKPKKKLNVLLAGVVGLFLTVFLAFFIEYISRHKDSETKR